MSAIADLVATVLKVKCDRKRKTWKQVDATGELLRWFGDAWYGYPDFALVGCDGLPLLSKIQGCIQNSNSNPIELHNRY